MWADWKASENAKNAKLKADKQTIADANSTLCVNVNRSMRRQQNRIVGGRRQYT